MSMNSLGAAASGIDSMQTDINTIGNDIANSQTDGFASQTVEFSDLLTQQLQPAGGPIGTTLASTNPSAIGAGVEVSAIRSNFNPGTVTQTGIASNVAIEGNGFLVVNQSGNTYYTMNGDLQVDANGHLATNTGGLIQGWAAGQPTSAPTTALSIVVGSTGPAVETKNVTLGGNLPSNPTSPVTVTTTMYDSLGDQVPVTLTFTPNTLTGATPTSWTLQGTVPNPAAPPATTNLWTTAPVLTFNASGQLATINGGPPVTGASPIPITVTPAGYTWSTTPPVINIDFSAPGSQNAVTQFASTQTLAVTSQDGNAAGTLSSFSIGPSGTITGTYSNGGSETLGTVALAQFANPNGLDSLGQTYFTPSIASGKAELGQPGTNGLGTLQGGSVVGSNVDLAIELTDLIQAQTAYQANTKVVATTGAVMQSLMQMP